VFDLKMNVPMWAMRRAGPEDRSLVRDAHSRGTRQIQWPNLRALRAWAKQHGWPTPLFGFEEAFISTLLVNDVNFIQGVIESGIEILIPKQDATLSSERLGELDALYAERSTSGRPTGWGSLTEDLREMRRAVEAGVVLRIEGEPALTTWQGFYDWAHRRYYMLEDGYDSWIGDDRS
jgi:hypothetical protein